jgi:hypothetical protein
VLTFTGPLWLWNAAKGSWHFITVPEEQSLRIRAESFVGRGRFRSVKVAVTIGDATWRTSVFPQREGTYLLPVKADVRQQTGIAAGDQVEVSLQVCFD